MMSDEWAIAPLLDPRNVGKLVWFSWNSNRATAEPIAKVGRTNIHVGRYASSSLRVAHDGSTASGSSGGYSVSATTNAVRMERDLRHELTTRILRFDWHRATTEMLAAVTALLDEAGGP